MAITSLTDLASVRDYLNRIGAKPTSLKSATITETLGKYKSDRVTIRFDEKGEVTVFMNSEQDSDEFEPTNVEQKAICEEWAKIKWPEPKRIPRITNAPPQISEASSENIFEFKEGDGTFCFIQVRGEDANGEKHYWPWTFYDDGQWRPGYPSWKLPIYNAHLLKNASIVFIHEGAKAARRVQEMVEAKTPDAAARFVKHPWANELAGGVHVGWIGGAPNPHRTDWSVMNDLGIKRAYIIADNDTDGRRATPKISFNLDMPCYVLEFTDIFPEGFDLGDDFPQDDLNFFGKIDGEYYYKGPTFRQLLHPATWATRKIVTGKKGRPSYQLSPNFISQWDYIEEVDMYVNKEFPEIMRTETVLNKMLAPFSDVLDTTRLMSRHYHGRQVKLTYNPGLEGRSLTYRGSSAINLHIPTEIKSKPGDITPFMEFMDYMFPSERERKEMLRWCATLIARPEVKMGYGILLVSRKQGVGKTTLASYILAPLVGSWNTSYPSESDINNPFNGWIARKRLAVVNEIYSGHSWKAYNSLKSVITDKEVDVNEKFMRQVTVENWCHVFACSNSERALKMENDDRRWFYPKVTEIIWPREKFDALYLWLQSGGLSIIRHWAENYGDYVGPSDRAPMTERKKDLIEGSRSEAQQAVAVLAELAMERSDPVALFIGDVVEYVHANIKNKVWDHPRELKNAMLDVGMQSTTNDYYKIRGRKQSMVYNNALASMVEALESEGDKNKLDLVRRRQALVKNYLIRPEELIGDEI